MSLTTLATAKGFLGIPDATTEYDDRVNRLIGAASGAIEKRCNRTFDIVTYTEFFDGRSQNEVLLSSFPVTSVTSVHVSTDRTFDATTLVDTADYFVDTECGLVRFHNARLPRGSKNVQVIYEAGYATVPQDLEYACLMYIQYLYNHRDDQRVGVDNKGKSQENVTYIHGMPADVKELLEPFVIADPWTTRGVQNI